MPIVDNGTMSNILTELKRRNVFRVAAAYTVVAWTDLKGITGFR